MEEDYISINWQGGHGESVEIGYLNHNGQQCCEHCGVREADHGQFAYKTECTICVFMVLMGLICMKDDAPNVRMAHQVFGTGKLFKIQ